MYNIYYSLREGNMKYIKILFVFAFISIVSFVNAQPDCDYCDHCEYNDYLNIGEKITFLGENYYFSWSDNPQEYYYEEEFYPKGDTPQKYNKMFGISAYISNETDMDTFVEGRTALLDFNMKKDPLCNYSIGKNDEEYILDIIFSNKYYEEKTKYVEYKLEIYKQISINGIDSVLVKTYSRRAYDDDITPFLDNLNKKKGIWYNELKKAKFEIKFKG